MSKSNAVREILVVAGVIITIMWVMAHFHVKKLSSTLKQRVSEAYAIGIEDGRNTMLFKYEVDITKPDGSKEQAVIVAPQVTDDILSACGVEKDDKVVVNIVTDWKKSKVDTQEYEK